MGQFENVKRSLFSVWVRCNGAVQIGRAYEKRHSLSFSCSLSEARSRTSLRVFSGGGASRVGAFVAVGERSFHAVHGIAGEGVALAQVIEKR